MKKYLFGLGAMLVGAGLMFVLMHGEVSAEGEAKKPEPFVCSTSPFFGVDDEGYRRKILNCKSDGITCGVILGNLQPIRGISCVKSGGLFK